MTVAIKHSRETFDSDNVFYNFQKRNHRIFPILAKSHTVPATAAHIAQRELRG